MPKDPRSLLGTPREITINFVDPGEHWHNNLKNSIIKSLENNNRSYTGKYIDFSEHRRCTYS